ncbi:DNA repair protein RecO [Truepera radiovictrix]|uniref:DNA repair protein RecO n=1 Tax=Truepera radiovictrix (strain DSM 17093 / CIP 108686 / LMG 22925 / RQ-24) TaxID=649638 RepID=D7CTG5_TRURR|nr:DNA repair protein RecO [Truepera radiovictrix]ADI13822.1 DNA repair protein RecO [Truepera radiovictrix DSM 17093]WMT57613.1 DNA repair protein RecO [Truepera radiovictrix]
MGKGRYTVREGIVLRRSELPSGDVVVTLLSETGKWRAVARKGKLVGGNLGKLSLFHDVTVQQYGRNGGSDELALITQVQLNGALPRLSDPAIYPYAHVLAELTDKLAVEVQLEGQLYHLFAGALRGLSRHPDPEAVALVMGWRLLAQGGLAPRLARCARCGGPLEGSGEGRFDVAAGGLSCAACASGFRVAAPVVDDLIALHRQSVREVLARPLEPRRAHWTLLLRYLTFHVGELKSLSGLATQGPEPTPPPQAAAP